mmetsp:Transcript_21315/g.64132  ORF Transcript_21315/g.64132 Transcript_21315/m.64132 type:complete len:416 (+) Transcript_21315:2806-4053(+)
MMGESELVRYRVALMAATLGSAAASSTNRCVLLPKLWYGCCTSTSPERMARKIEVPAHPPAGPAQRRRLRRRFRRRGATSLGCSRGFHAGHTIPFSSFLLFTGRLDRCAMSSRPCTWSTFWAVSSLSSSVSSRASAPGMSPATSSLTNGANRRSRSSSATMSRRSSASSSCLSRSALRVTLKTCTALMMAPPNSWPRLCSMICSTGMNACCQLSPSCAAEGGTSYHLEKLGGILTIAYSGCPLDANWGSPDCSRGSSKVTARLRLPEGRYGKGCAGSSLIGVSSSSSSLWKYLFNLSAPVELSSEYVRMRMPAERSAGSTSPCRARPWAATIALTSPAIMFSCCSGSHFSGPVPLRSVVPAATCRMRPPTRLAKNSSRLRDAMAMNCRRSSNGVLSADAKLITRQLKASQLSSTL